MFSRLQERKQARSWNAGLRSPLPNSPRYPAGEMHFEVGMVLAVPSFHVMPKIFQSSPWCASLLFPFRKAQPPLFLFLELGAESFVKKKESVTFREAEAGNGLCVPKNWTKSIHSGRLSDRDCHEDQSAVC